jgi:hypothetical protein
MMQIKLQRGKWLLKLTEPRCPVVEILTCPWFQTLFSCDLVHSPGDIIDWCEWCSSIGLVSSGPGESCTLLHVVLSIMSEHLTVLAATQRKSWNCQAGKRHMNPGLVAVSCDILGALYFLHTIPEHHIHTLALYLLPAFSPSLFYRSLRYNSA